MYAIRSYYVCSVTLVKIKQFPKTIITWAGDVAIYKKVAEISQVMKIKIHGQKGQIRSDIGAAQPLIEFDTVKNGYLIP